MKDGTDTGESGTPDGLCFFGELPGIHNSPGLAGKVRFLHIPMMIRGCDSIRFQPLNRVNVGQTTMGGTLTGSPVGPSIGDYGADVMLWTIIGVVAAVTLLIGVMALLAEHRHRKLRRDAQRVLAQRPISDSAYRAVVNARSAFTRSVQVYEEAIASAPTTAALTGVGEAALSAEIEVIERTKDYRRTRLLEAQRLWEQVRPALGPDSPVQAWIGTGGLGGWSLGLVGFESALVRFEHALDPTCWVIVETRRWRFGPAIGFERLRLGMLVEGADIGQLIAVVQAAMGSPEVALRPGLSLIRLATGSRGRASGLLKTLRNSARERPSVLIAGISDVGRRDALSYLATERGLQLEDPHAGLSRPSRSIRLRIASSGPAVLAGAWVGRRPTARIIAGSNHQEWIRG